MERKIKIIQEQAKVNERCENGKRAKRTGKDIYCKNKENRKKDIKI